MVVRERRHCLAVLTKPSPNLYTTDQAPRYTSGLTSNLILFILIIVLVGLSALWIRFLNGKHAAARVRLGKSAEVVDLSMESSSALKTKDELANESTGTGVGDKAFEDLTDLQNEDFIYLY